MKNLSIFVSFLISISNIHICILNTTENKIISKLNKSKVGKVKNDRFQESVLDIFSSSNKALRNTEIKSHNINSRLINTPKENNPLTAINKPLATPLVSKNDNKQSQSNVDLAINSDQILSPSENIDVLLSGWLRIYSLSYKNLKLFPNVPLPGNVERKISIDEDNDFRLNDKFVNDADYFKRFQFFFRVSKKNIYYSEEEKDLIILDSLPIKRITSVENYPVSNPEKATCFTLLDSEKISDWTLCAMDLTSMKKWSCQIKNIIGQLDQDCKNNSELVLPPTIIEQKITQPILLIPQPSKQCNEDWNYYKKGEDWECECSEGKEQSPIDLPSSRNALDSPVKPIFMYEEQGPKEKIINETGDEKEVDLNFRYKENMLQIESHVAFGKVITLDGRIYKANKIVFHTPSEHTIDGKQYAMEMQIIHNGVTKGDIAKQVIVSVLFKKKAGTYNRFIDSLDFFNLPNYIHTDEQISKTIFIPDVLYNSDSEDISIMKPVSFYTYQGSLSFPPCNERAIVYVLSKPIPLSTTAIQLFIESIRVPDFKDSQGNITVHTEKAENNRKVQPLNGRKVFFYDHVKYCGADPVKVKPIEKASGHYEKVKSKVTQYLYVNSDTPSSLPHSFVVSEAEAKGKNN